MIFFNFQNIAYRLHVIHINHSIGRKIRHNNSNAPIRRDFKNYSYTYE